MKELKKKRLQKAIPVILAAVILFCPFSFITYNDGGTVRIQSLTWCVMVWKRDIRTVDQDGNLIPAEEQKPRFYFVWDCHKEYEELWKIAH